MTVAATFLAGAKSRLLPATIPFRFFAAAAGFQVLMWLALTLNSGEVTGFRGGVGPVLAAIHLLTLGVLAMTAIGASAQLLPVATRRPLAAFWPIKLVSWLVIPGTAALALAMYTLQTTIMIPAAIATTAGLLVFTALLGDNLRRAGSLPVVAAYGWAALAALVLLVGLGVALALDYEIALLPDHANVALAHLILGGFGFMGLLALGFSHVLIPMFALAAAPARRSSLIGFFLAVSAVMVGALGALAGSAAMLTLGALVGLGACGLHLWLMHAVLKSGMRKRLGLSFVLIRVAWLILPTTLIVGIAVLYGLAGPNGSTLFGFLLVGGWLLTFLLGVLQRILPFLASMHATRPAGSGPPLTSELAASELLKLHSICHLAALGLITVSIALDLTWLAAIGGAIGLVGSGAFAWFTATITRRAVATHR